MELKGTIKKILPMQSGKSQKGNDWQKVEFVVEETGEAYPDTVCISAMNDHVQELMGINQGDLVNVEFSCRCNEYNGKVYNSISLFKITKIEGQQQAPAPQPFPQQGQTSNDNDGLPF